MNHVSKTEEEGELKEVMIRRREEVKCKLALFTKYVEKQNKQE